MKQKTDLLVNSGLRGFQMLFAVVVLGLSVTLVNDHNKRGAVLEGYHLSGPPLILPLSAAIGAVTFIAAAFNLAIVWTEFLKEYIELIIDVILIVANMVGGTIMAIKLHGKNCSERIDANIIGDNQKRQGSLADIDILNGGCALVEDDQIVCYNWAPDTWGKLNQRCTQSQADSVFMFITVVLLFMTMALTYLRLKKNL